MEAVKAVWKLYHTMTPTALHLLQARLLEVGCGTSDLAQLLHTRHIGHVTAIDFSQEAVLHHAQRSPVANSPRYLVSAGRMLSNHA